MQGITVTAHKPQFVDVHMDFSQKKYYEFLLTSDHHWDNPKCDRELLKNHMDEAVRRGAGILLNGDTFCLMQGKGDPRGSKDDIRPEHNNGRYLDSIVETALEWYSPYASSIISIGYGNHESSCIKHRETDVLQRFVDLMNYKNGTQINCGGYGGYVIFKGSLSETNSGQRPRSLRMYMFHGSGGGGVVTKGVIGNNRRASSVDADIYWTGHIHESWVHHDVMISPDLNNKRIIERPVTHVCTSTYKREWNAKGGWHTERGAPMKPIGSAWLRIYADRQSGGTRSPYMYHEITPCLNQY